MGFAQDPDADRLAIVDENGVYIGEEYSLALCAKWVLSRRPGVVVTNLSSSRMLDDIAAAHGSKVLRTPVGEANVIQAMIGAGSTIGGLTSLASAWYTQHHQDHVRRLSGEKTRREKLYKQFINEASKLYADALVHDKAEVSALVSVYALVSRMRVVSSSPVIAKAEAVVLLILDTYSVPNKTSSDLRDLIGSHAVNPLRAFSEECRAELQALNYR